MAKNKKNTIIKGLLGIFAFILFFISFNNVITGIEKARDDAISDSRTREFAILWEYNKVIENNAYQQAEQIARRVERQIRDSYDLDELETELNANDPIAQNEIYDIFRQAINGQYLNGIKNNRNAMMVLEGYDNIIEDKFIEPHARQNPDLIPDNGKMSFDNLYQNSYNSKLFKSARDKIRSHTTNQLIGLEPFNIMKDDSNHTLISEMNFNTLEKVYIEEGLDGFKNYQFFAPVYITDTGDIFGESDTIGGIPQNTHKYIIIQTYNLYDQIMTSNPSIKDDAHIGHITRRYNDLLTKLYMCGLIVCCIFIFLILYFLTLYNTMIDIINITTTKDDDENEEVNDP